MASASLTRLRFSLALLCALWPRYAAAQATRPGDAPAAEGDGDGAYGARARVSAERISRRAADATASATRLDLTQRSATLESVAEVLAEVPGTSTTQTGGYGSPSSVSLRGHEPSHTAWLLGDVPLGDPDSGAFDASLLPLEHMARLEVYRGGAPVWLSQGSIAGAVRIVPREGRGSGVRARLTQGSSGLWQALAQGHVTPEDGGVAWFTGATVADSRGDYLYLDDNTTRFDASDDVERRVRNAQLTQATGLSHLTLPLLGGRLSALVTGVRRIGGVPGAVGLGSNALRTRRDDAQARLTASYMRRGALGGRPYRAQLLLSGALERSQLRDPYGELALGGPASRDDRRTFGYARTAAQHDLLSMLGATLMASYGVTDGARRDALQPSRLGDFQRTVLAAAGELRLFGTLGSRPGELRASLRGEWSRVRAQTLEVSRPVTQRNDDRNHTLRLAAASEPLAGLTVRASVGTGSRAPAVYELFGDGVAVHENPRLQAERGRYADLGAVLDAGSAADALRGSGELSVFAQRVEDKIVFVSTNQFESIARNEGRADILGLEGGLDATLFDRSRVVASMTLLHTRTGSGRQLPRRPRLQTHVMIEQALARKAGALELAAIFATIDHESTAYFDRANETLRAALTHVGLGARLSWLGERLELSARVADLFDARGQDFLRFPLPGRSLLVSVTYKESSP